MKDKLTNKELQLKQATEGFSFDVDTADLWAAIEPQLPKKKRRAIGWYWIAGSIGIVLAIWVGAVTIDKTSTSQADNPQNENTPLIANNLIADKELETPSNPNKTQPPTNNFAHKVESIANQSKTIIKSTNTQATLAKENTKSTNTPQEHTSSASNNNYTSQSSIQPKKSIPADINTFTNIAITTPENSNQESQIDEDKEQIDRSKITSPSNIQMLGFTLFQRESTIALATPKITPLKKPSMGSFWKFQTGVNLPKFSLTATNNEGFDQSRFDREVPMVGLTSALQYGRGISNNFYWTAGVQHSRLISRYRHNDIVTASDTNSGTEGYRIDEEGNINALEGDITTTTINNYDVLWHKSHDLVDLQIGLGANLLQAGSWTISADANTSYTIWSRHTGYYFEEDKEGITKFEAGSEHPYQSPGLGFDGSLSIMYNIGDWSIGLSPSFGTRFGNLTKSTNYYQTKNSQYGLQVCTLRRL